MRIKVPRCLAVFLLLVGIVSTSVRGAEDLFNGTWKLNPDKSSYKSAAPKSTTITIKIENGIETYTSEVEDASGKNISTSFTAKLDGTDAPIAGNSYGDTISVKQQLPKSLVATITKDRKVVMKVHFDVSADGKKLSAYYSGNDADGNGVHGLLFYDKQ